MMFYYSPCCHEKMTEDIHNTLLCSECGEKYSVEGWQLAWESKIKSKKQILLGF